MVAYRKTGDRFYFKDAQEHREEEIQCLEGKERIAQVLEVNFQMTTEPTEAEVKAAVDAKRTPMKLEGSTAELMIETKGSR